MDYQGDPLAHAEDLEQRIEVAAVLDEAIRTRAAVGQLVGIAHADQVGGDAPAQRLQVRNDVAPQIGRSGVSVQEHDRVALPHVHLRHPASQDLAPTLFVGERCTNHGRNVATGVQLPHRPAGYI
jgi:hypothetical protein